MSSQSDYPGSDQPGNTTPGSSEPGSDRSGNTNPGGYRGGYPGGGYPGGGYPGGGYPWGGYPWGRQSWVHGFGPLFHGPYSDQHLRVSDAERQIVVDRLAQHFTDGRLDQAEFDERVERAMSAKTRADLNGLFDDLPGSDGLPETGTPAVPGFPRRRHRHPVLLVALIVVAIMVTAHALWWMAIPVVWVSVLVVALLFATGHLGRSRTHHDG
jgi:Domain of unknown function (DUF1707)